MSTKISCLSDRWPIYGRSFPDFFHKTATTADLLPIGFCGISSLPVVGPVFHVRWPASGGRMPFVAKNGKMKTPISISAYGRNKEKDRSAAVKGSICEKRKIPSQIKTINMEITGRSTGKAEVRTTKTGKEIVSFSIAINDSYRKKGDTEPTKIVTYVGTHWQHTASPSGSPRVRSLN